ncbi:MAG: hypothetical protein IRZ13_20115 [Acetobacteraceae bacterium]|nr:hypothetical protein [Acetobacteraceae bacterium]
MTRVVIGLFDRVDQAEQAVAELVRAAGNGLEAVELHGTGERPAAERGAADRTAARPVLAASLDALRLPAADATVLREGIRRGGIVIAAHVTGALIERTVAALEVHGAVDIEAREAEWRRAGRTDTDAARADEPETSGGPGGYTGHDEDIGFATYGGDAVVGRVPRQHRDDAPAGVLGRLEMAATMRRDPNHGGARARVYAPGPSRHRQES